MLQARYSLDYSWVEEILIFQPTISFFHIPSLRLNQPGTSRADPSTFKGTFFFIYKTNDLQNIFEKFLEEKFLP